jgi:hypothetical protein
MFRIYHKKNHHDHPSNNLISFNFYDKLVANQQALDAYKTMGMKHELKMTNSQKNLEIT